MSTEWKELVGNLVEDGDNANSDLETVIALKQQDTEEVALLLESCPSSNDWQLGAALIAKSVLPYYCKCVLIRVSEFLTTLAKKNLMIC